MHFGSLHKYGAGGLMVCFPFGMSFPRTSKVRLHKCNLTQRIHFANFLGRKCYFHLRQRTYPGASKWLVGKMKIWRFSDICRTNHDPWTNLQKLREQLYACQDCQNYVLKNLPTGEAFSSSTWNSSFRRDKDVPSPRHRAEIVGREAECKPLTSDTLWSCVSPTGTDTTQHRAQLFKAKAT